MPPRWSSASAAAASRGSEASISARSSSCFACSFALSFFLGAIALRSVRACAGSYVPSSRGPFSRHQFQRVTHKRHQQKQCKRNERVRGRRDLRPNATRAHDARGRELPGCPLRRCGSATRWGSRDDEQRGAVGDQRARGHVAHLADEEALPALDAVHLAHQLDGRAVLEGRAVVDEQVGREAKPCRRASLGLHVAHRRAVEDCRQSAAVGEDGHRVGPAEGVVEKQGGHAAVHDALVAVAARRRS
eukprot:6107051-Prymnesium_polylepis.2